MAAVRYAPLVLTCFILSAEAQTNITAEIIRAELGHDVILPCKAANKYNNIRAVEWIRPDQDPDYVLFYRDGNLNPDNQHPSYQNRVDLQDKDMKDGDVSLVLKNVTMEDKGTYECRVFEKRKNELISIITLEVYPSGDKDRVIGDRGTKDGGSKDGGDKVGIIVGSVVGVILVLLLAVAVFAFLINRRPMKKNPNLPVPPDEGAAKQML